MAEQWLAVDMAPGSEAGHIQSSASFSLSNLAPLLVNCFTLKRGEQYHLQKRPLFGYASMNPADGQFRGMHYWDATGLVYFVIAGSLYSIDPALPASITTLSTALDTTSRFVGFAELHTGAARYLILLDGVKGWYIDTSGNETQIVDADFPTPHIPTPVCFDGYVFVAKSNTQDIYNCNVTTPATWQASTFIRSEQFSGPLTAIAKHKNQLVAFHSDGITFFKNAGIPNPNSPLQRVVELSIDIGVDYYFNIRRHSDSLIYFMGTGNTSLGKVYKIEDQKISPIEAPIFEQILATYSEFASFRENRKVLSMEWFGQTFLLWEPTDPTATGADALTMVLNVTNGQLSFWMARDPDDETTPAFSTSTDNHLPLGLIELIRVDDQLVGWNHKTVTSPLVTLTTGMRIDPNDPDTLLVFHFNDSPNFYDSTGTYQYTGSNIGSSGGVAKFGSGSIFTNDGAGNPGVCQLDFNWIGTISPGDWTYECWVRVPSASTGAIAGIATPNDGTLTVAIRPDTDAVYWNVAGAGGSIVGPENVAAGTIDEDTWYHIAIVHTLSDTKYSLFFNGTRLKQVTSSDTLAVATTNRIGVVEAGAGGGAYIDEQRVSTVARYTGSTYTVPAAAFQDAGNSGGVGAVESYIDLVYRSPLLTGDTPANKTLCDVVVDGMDYPSTTEGTANPGTLIVYSYDNVSPRRVIGDAARTVTYTDVITRPHTTIHPVVPGKSFIVEWQYGINNDSDPRAWNDFFGKIYYRLQAHGRMVAGT